MRRFLIFLPLLLTLAMVGCGGGGNKLVGTWSGNFISAPAEFKYNADNTFSISVTNPANPSQQMVLNGEYKLDGDKLTMTLKGGEAKGAPPEEAQAFKQMIAGQLNKPDTATLKWKGDNEVDVTTQQGMTNTLKRK